MILSNLPLPNDRHHQCRKDSSRLLSSLYFFIFENREYFHHDTLHFNNLTSFLDNHLPLLRFEILLYGISSSFFKVTPFVLVHYELFSLFHFVDNLHLFSCFYGVFFDETFPEETHFFDDGHLAGFLFVAEDEVLGMNDWWSNEVIVERVERRSFF